MAQVSTLQARRMRRSNTMVCDLLHLFTNMPNPPRSREPALRLPVDAETKSFVPSVPDQNAATTRTQITVFLRKSTEKVFGEVADEVLTTFEAHLSEALSEGNIREASQLWRRLLDTPGVKLLAKERWLWAGAQRAVRQHLSGYMSEESVAKAARATNATAEFALQFA